MQWGLRYPDAANRILTREELDARWNGAQRAFLLAPDDRIAALPYGTMVRWPHADLQPTEHARRNRLRIGDQGPAIRSKCLTP